MILKSLACFHFEMHLDSYLYAKKYHVRMKRNLKWPPKTFFVVRSCSQISARMVLVFIDRGVSFNLAPPDCLFSLPM